MKTATISDAREQLDALVRQAQDEMIGLTDEDGNLVGLLAGVSEGFVDNLLVLTPGFKEMVARARASLENEPTVSAEEILAEALAEIEAEKTSAGQETPGQRPSTLSPTV